ncbi:MAG: hypothetical protein IPK85_11970 [Gemmatimonadetes bacterium]|nr:hypothetical protein [Gemmatimonadota bacterium]
MNARMTVVVPVVTDLDHAVASLEYLERERESFALAVLAVSRLPNEVGTSIRARFPWLKWMQVDADTSIPAMRALGVGLAESEVIAFVEDHVHVPPGWAREMCERVGATGAVVAGPVEDASESFASRSAFLCEYSAALPPVASGPQRSVPGNNTAYPAVLLRSHIDMLVQGGWEDELHAALSAQGVGLRLEEAVRAFHALEVGVGEYSWLRYHYSRAWAGRRSRGAPFARRMLGALKCVALPPVLLSRIVGRGLRRTRYRRIALISLPLQVLFVVAWAAGELVGNLAGPGRSLTKVR